MGPHKVIDWRIVKSSDPVAFAAVGAGALAFFLIGLSGLGVPANVDDEAHFASSAFQFADHTQIASPLLAALLPGADEHLYWQPPLYTIVSGAWIAVLGKGVFQIRLLSALAGAAVVILVAVLARRLGGSRREALLAALLTLTSAFVFYGARMGRMDILVAALVLAALVAYGNAVRRGFEPAWITVAGWLLGLALLLHPLGIVPGVALGIALLVERRPQALKSFLWPLALCMAAWLGFALLDWRSFQDQMGLQTSGMTTSFVQPFTAAKFHLPALALGTAAVVALALRSWRRDPLARAVVITSLALFAGVVYGRGTYYVVYVFPLFASCLPALIQWAAARRFAWIVVGVVVLVSMAEGLHDAQDVVSGGPSRGEFASEIRQAVPPGTDVFIGPGGGGAYFALADRNRMSSWVALPLEEGAQARVARRSDYVIAEHGPMTAWLPELREVVGGGREVARVSAGGASIVTIWKR